MEKKEQRRLKEFWRRLRLEVRRRMGNWQSWAGSTISPPPPRAWLPFAAWNGRSKRAALSRPLVEAAHVAHPPPCYRDPHPAFRAEPWEECHASFRPLSLFEIPLARTAGKQGAVITDDNVLIAELAEISWDHREHPFLAGIDYPAERRVKRLKGTFGLAHSLYNSTYHWLFETLPRLELLRRSGGWERFDGILLHKPKFEAHLATLDLLGLPREKIVWCTAGSHYLVDRLVAAPMPVEHSFHPPWVHPFLRALPGVALDGSPRRRLLIHRGEAGVDRRRVVNQEAMARELRERFGFEEVQIGAYPFVEQARLFASAEWIVAPHGAGLSNLVFAPPGAGVIEIFTPDYTPTMFRNLAWEAGLRYQPLMAAETGEAHRLGKDLHVDVDALIALVSAMGKP